MIVTTILKITKILKINRGKYKILQVKWALCDILGGHPGNICEAGCEEYIFAGLVHGCTWGGRRGQFSR